VINLLPDSHKGEIRAARTNVILVRYIAIFTVAILVLSGIIVAAYVVLDTRKASAQSLLDVNNARAAKYNSIRSEADSLRSSLSSAKSILDQKVSYSKLIYVIADSLPEGVVLDTLDLDSTSFGSSMTINASAKTFESASKLRDKFASNSTVFSDVKLLSLESGAADGTGGDYPVKVSVSLIINKAALQ